MTHVAGFPTYAICPKSSVTIGVFDGMHRGHVAFLHALANHAHQHGHDAVVVTFDPHPDSVIHPDTPTPLLITPAERIARMHACGIDHVISIAFNHDIQAMSAAEFMHAIKNATNLCELWIGWDFALGRHREGDATRLTAIGETLGYSTHVVARYDNDSIAPSSSAIRTALRAGEMAHVTQLLGYTFGYHGIVVKGDQRGRTIGFPTANIAVDQRLILPRFGVYASLIHIDNKPWVAVTNIGQRPTFHGVEVRIEAHILDFSQDIYDQHVSITLHAFLRAEQRFSGIDALVAQITQDVYATRTHNLLETRN